MTNELSETIEAFDWQVQNLKLIAFPIENPDLAGAWKTLTGTDPESSVVKKTTRTDSGLFDSKQFTLSVDPLRVQWIVTPHIDPETLLERFPLVGPFKETSEWFVRSVSKWLESAPALKRIAWAGALFMKVESPEDATLKINKLLKRVSILKDVTDFQYRINRKTNLVVEDESIQINRLVTWATARITTEVEVKAGDSRAPLPVPDAHYVTLEFDINTSVDHQLLKASGLRELTGKLVEQSFRIAMHGDDFK